MRRGVLVTVALMLVGATPAAGEKVAPAETTSVAPSLPQPGAPAGFPNLAFLDSIGGLPPDSRATRAFIASFRGAFTDEYFLTERTDVEASSVSDPLTNRFHLAEGNAFGDEWKLGVTIEGWWGFAGRIPPPADTVLVRRRGSGLRVAISVLSASAADSSASPVMTRQDVMIEDPSGPHMEFFSHAGRTVGLLAIESLHHRSGDLDADVRVQLDRAVRAPVVERAVPAPRR
jgi:hypothetical protein